MNEIKKKYLKKFRLQLKNRVSVEDTVQPSLVNQIITQNWLSVCGEANVAQTTGDKFRIIIIFLTQMSTLQCNTNIQRFR